LTTNHNLLTITIADNGQGFDQSLTKRNNNGLRNMKNRIETIGGTFSITTSAGTGSTIYLSVPFQNLQA
jgi:signal transduction histidine kinase